MSKIEVNAVEPQCGTTLTLGASGDTVTLGSGASQSGFGRTGTVDWQTSSIKTATFTAVDGEGYFCNTTSGSFTVNLPAGSAGAIVSVQDYNNTFDTNALTVNPNGTEKINGGIAGGAVSLGIEGQGVTLVYIDSTVGWRSVQENEFNEAGENFITATGGTITTVGSCKIHTFTGPGTFCVTSLATTPANNQVSYIVVAGGGGGGNRGTPTGEAGGAGGAGGFREDKSPTTPYTASPLEGAGTITVTATGFPITVGGGGPGAPGCAQPGVNSSTRNGSNSVFSTITSTGGGGGGTRAGTTPSPGIAGGSPGGSGGGGSYSGPVNNGEPGGTGNTPSVSPAQGKNGGNGPASGGGGSGGGGGGATVAGTAAAQTTPNHGIGGPGGAGATTCITGSPTAYAGGGGGGGNEPGYPGVGVGGTGGTGGGGQGGDRSPTNPAGVAGTANTGGGGGGGSGCGAGGTGGSGVVIIRYKFQ